MDNHNTQTVLPCGTVDEVRQQVEEHVRVFAPGGGFVFAGVHNIQFGVPPENLLAAVDTAWQQGTYPG